MSEQNKIDARTLFAALQGEMNSRITARAAINVAHLQVIMAFAGAYLVSAAVDAKGAGFAAVISALIPLVSFYFVSLYSHNDIQIGLLNRTLRRIEDLSDLPEQLRFLTVGAESGEASYAARRISHRAVVLLCLTSPALVVASMVMRPWSGPLTDPLPWLALAFAVAISLANWLRLRRVQKKRDDLIAS